VRTAALGTVSPVAKSARTENVRLNQLRAQQEAADRRRRVVIAVSAVVAVVVLVAALIVASLLAPNNAASGSSPLDPAVAATLGGVPASAFDTVGAGAGASNPPKSISGAPLTADGKPKVLYVGAEFCPYCAAERWPFVVAMARFGQFGNLQAASSAAAPEVFPNTPTLSFHGATYTSQYLSFTGVETQTNTHQPLETLSAEDQKVFDTNNPDGSIPFIDYGGKATSSGASVDASLFAGKTQAEIATAIADPSTPIAKAVLGSANVITARLCQLTGTQPAAVCSSAGVAAVAASVK
jgi:hypothetical protein